MSDAPSGRTARLTSRRLAVAAILALTLAAAIVRQESGPNQAAHYALVRALASGTAEIDPRETIDAAFVDGRYYAAKAPGLAMLVVPWYAVLRVAGLQDDPRASVARYRGRLWQLTLAGAVLPWLVLLVLMRSAAERVAPGWGTAAAVLLSTGTLLLPFATLLFAHLLSAALGFLAFWLLLRTRDRASPWWHVTVAGGVAGVAVVVEFGLALVAAVLGCLAVGLAGGGRLRRGAAYAGGVLAGVTPLLAYNTWAFGSPATLSYTNALTAPAGEGAPAVGANEEGLYGVTLPGLREAMSLLFSEKGLLVVSPLCAIALAGLPLLWRAGRRAEALVCAAVPAAFLVYNAAYYLPFGGQGPGPRFLVPALPFLVLPLVAALRAWPLPVAGVGVASAGVMTLATVTGPVTGVEHGIELWLERLGDGAFVDSPVGPPAGALAFTLLVGAALVLAVVSLPDRAWSRQEPLLLLAALGAWLVVVRVTPELLPADAEHGTREGAVAVLVLAVALGAGLALAWRRGAAYLVPLVPLALLAAPQLTSRPRWSALLVALLLVSAVVAWRRLATSQRGGADREAAL